MNLANAETLKAMTPEQLRETGERQGIKFRSNATSEYMNEAIMNNMQPMTKPEPVKEILPEPEQKENTEEDVREAIKPHIDKGMEARFPGDGTWSFRYMGAEDTGSLTAPLKVIKMKAATVARGALVIKRKNSDDFAHMPTNARSAYTGQIM